MHYFILFQIVNIAVSLANPIFLFFLCKKKLQWKLKQQLIEKQTIFLTLSHVLQYGTYPSPDNNDKIASIGVISQKGHVWYV